MTDWMEMTARIAALEAKAQEQQQQIAELQRNQISDGMAIAGLQDRVPKVKIEPTKPVCGTCGGSTVRFPLFNDGTKAGPCPDCQPEQTKPSWDDAPKWAQWLAQDSDGEWCFFSHKPQAEPIDTLWYIPGDVSPPTKYTAVIGAEPNPNWRDTLEQRPEQEPTKPSPARMEVLDWAIGRKALAATHKPEQEQQKVTVRTANPEYVKKLDKALREQEQEGLELLNRRLGIWGTDDNGTPIFNGREVDLYYVLEWLDLAGITPDTTEADLEAMARLGWMRKGGLELLAAMKGQVPQDLYYWMRDLLLGDGK